MPSFLYVKPPSVLSSVSRLDLDSVHAERSTYCYMYFQNFFFHNSALTTISAQSFIILQPLYSTASGFYCFYDLPLQRNIQQPILFNYFSAYTSFYREISLFANFHITGVMLASYHSYSTVARSASLLLGLEWCSIKPQDVNKTCWLPRRNE